MTPGGRRCPQQPHAATMAAAPPVPEFPKPTLVAGGGRHGAAHMQELRQKIAQMLLGTAPAVPGADQLPIIKQTHTGELSLFFPAAQTGVLQKTTWAAHTRDQATTAHVDAAIMESWPVPDESWVRVALRPADVNALLDKLGFQTSTETKWMLVDMLPPAASHFATASSVYDAWVAALGLDKVSVLGKRTKRDQAAVPDRPPPNALHVPNAAPVPEIPDWDLIKSMTTQDPYYPELS